MQRRSFLTTSAAMLAAPHLARASEDAIRLRDFYARGGGLSELALEREGKPVRVSGFMAPPLKADSTFFVLTKQPMSVCPFCETEADWPDNIMAVYTQRKFRVVAFNRKIETSGILSLGAFRDPETGFLSMVRIEDARFETA
ncbi:MAG: hypothetical protein AAFQ19_06365 [Pseudomonadota bacterium]